MTLTPLLTRHIATPLGPMIALAEARGLCLLDYVDRDGLDQMIAKYVARFGYVQSTGDSPLLDQLKAELGLYFDGRLTAFSIPLCLQGTQFQQQVWTALRKLPFGETRAYRTFAESIGKPKAIRAVGRANGQNPISIVVPCHRLVGSDGSLTGYGGGQQRKAALLALEQHEEWRLKLA